MDLERGKKLPQNLFLLYFYYVVSWFWYGQGMSCSHISEFCRRPNLPLKHDVYLTLTPFSSRSVSMDLRIRGGRRVSWDKVREWHGHIYTAKCKIDS